MDICKRPILIALPGGGIDRVTCSHPADHSEWHIGTLRDGRRYEWTTAEACARGRFC